MVQPRHIAVSEQGRATIYLNRIFLHPNTGCPAFPLRGIRTKAF